MGSESARRVGGPARGRGSGILTSAVPGARSFYSQSLEPEIRIEERSHWSSLLLWVEGCGAPWPRGRVASDVNN